MPEFSFSYPSTGIDNDSFLSEVDALDTDAEVRISAPSFILISTPNSTTEQQFQDVIDGHIDTLFVNYCEDKKVEVDCMLTDAFEGHFYHPKHPDNVRRYLKLVHTLKAEVANSHWNANDKPGTENPRKPEAVRADDQDATQPYYFLLTRESAERSISLNALVGAVKGMTDIELGAIDDIEEIRSPKKDLIDVERDRETVPGTKDNDYSAVDQIITDVQTAIAGFNWTPVL